MFADLGLGVGDHVAVLMENRLEMFPVVWAAQRSGLFYTPVNWHLTPGEAAYIVDNCGASVLVSTPLRADLAQACVATAAREVTLLSVGGNLDELAAAAPATPRPEEVEGIYMFYSSGTTDRPKCILPALARDPFGTGLAIEHMMGTAFGFGGTRCSRMRRKASRASSSP